LHKDKEVLRAYADGVLEGLAIAIGLVGAKRGIIGIKGKYEDVIALLKPKLAANVEIVPLRDAYPAGDEFILVYDCLGRVVPPGGIPLAVGAVVMNVETAVNVAMADRQPVTEKFLTVAGAVANPVTLRVPVGVTLAECVAAAGGPTVPDANYMVGGVMMGWLEENHQALVDKTTGGILVLPDDHVVIRRRRQDWNQIARIGRSACDQCSFCTELCPRWLLGHPIEPHRAMRSLGFNQIGEVNVIGTSFCCECNLCSLYSCPEDLDPKNVCTHNKRRLAAEKRRWENPPLNPRRPELHLENRKAPMHRLFHKLGLTQFHNVGPLDDQLLEAAKVGIKLKQHLGAPCEPAVKQGERVKKGQMVGRVPVANGKPALGAPVHASIDGTVTKVADGVVWIEKNGMME
jgi:Na+-translocating ferredoxin:NAD+ oxidoreductase RnfC subunit